MVQYLFCLLSLWLAVNQEIGSQGVRESRSQDISLKGWRGERLSAQLWVELDPGRGEDLMIRTTDENVSVSFVNEVLTDSFNTCGKHPEGLLPYPVNDVIENTPLIPCKKGPLPLWCTVEIPSDMKKGHHPVKIELIGTESRRCYSTLQLDVEVIDRTLPPPGEQKFHVDFWQQPYAVSRYHQVERWSQQHFDLLHPYLQLLARAGQKVATAILFYEPWGDQSHDKFDAMIKSIRHEDGTWEYDYSVFDHWIELCDSCGINQQINCYSMIPWDMRFLYYQGVQGDKESGSQGVKEVTLKTTTDSKEYAELWKPFLQAFARHLKEKGWFEKTCIAMDERGLKNMLDAYRIVQEAVPGMKMALAGYKHQELLDKVYDYCFSFFDKTDEEELLQRRQKGFVTTMYTCCSNTFPNIFSNSHPIEATFLPLYAYANGFDGYLHWSWMNWNDDPLHDTRYRLFGSGDTFCIYPGPRSSVRFESFIKGVQLTEKVRILLENETGEKREALQQALNAFKAVPTSAEEISSMVDSLEKLVNAVP